LRPNEGIENGENTMEALKTMEQANRIIEDFTPGQFALYTFVYGIQIALCFWVALKLL
jgi:hypothetical protein